MKRGVETALGETLKHAGPRSVQGLEATPYFFLWTLDCDSHMLLLDTQGRSANMNTYPA